jgi:hypothetical protein
VFKKSSGPALKVWDYFNLVNYLNTFCTSTTRKLEHLNGWGRHVSGSLSRTHPATNETDRTGAMQMLKFKPFDILSMSANGDKALAADLLTLYFKAVRREP